MFIILSVWIIINVGPSSVSAVWSNANCLGSTDPVDALVGGAVGLVVAVIFGTELFLSYFICIIILMTFACIADGYGRIWGVRKGWKCGKFTVKCSVYNIYMYMKGGCQSFNIIKQYYVFVSIILVLFCCIKTS